MSNLNQPQNEQLKSELSDAECEIQRLKEKLVTEKDRLISMVVNRGEHESLESLVKRLRDST